MKKTKIKTKININKIIFYSNLFFAVSSVLLVFIHFIQFTGAASEGFVLGKLNSRMTELKSENKDLNLKSAELQSIDNIKERSEKN